MSNYVCSECGSENTKAVSFNGREWSYECLDCTDRTPHSPSNAFGEYAQPYNYGEDAWP